MPTKQSPASKPTYTKDHMPPRPIPAPAQAPAPKASVPVPPAPPVKRARGSVHRSSMMASGKPQVHVPPRQIPPPAPQPSPAPQPAPAPQPGQRR